ncbi:MAG: Rossmann-like and DUF2520 domain-containing protein [Butyribacter sp.]|nr:DUF2520 domain-containing protein [bacterium]MDY3854995.1 Rossmann-like and DUF2520 domain-containing protein [Butyribacter sp.]
MVIGIIGAGKVGTTLGAYLKEHNISVSGYYSRSIESAREAANFTKTKIYQSVEEIIGESDTLFLTTPDGEIRNVWDCIISYSLTGKTICHFSGSLSSRIFSGIETTGAVGCSIHPMYAFSDKFTSYQQFHTAYLTMEGNSEAVSKMQKLFGDRLGHKILKISAQNKIKYHAAAALASNYMVGLFQASLDLLGDCGFSEEDSRQLLAPLVMENVKAMLEKGTVQALTGPIERNDVETVEKHRAAINSTGVEEIYDSLGRELVAIAERKNPDRDYAKIKNMLKRD